MRRKYAAHYKARKSFIIWLCCDVTYTHKICFLAEVLWITHTLQVMNLLPFDVSNTVLSLSSSSMQAFMLIDVSLFHAFCSEASLVWTKVAGGQFIDGDLCVHRRTVLGRTACHLFAPVMLSLPCVSLQSPCGGWWGGFYDLELNSLCY